MSSYQEADLEQAVLEFFEELYYECKYGPDISPDGEEAERESYHEVVLKERLREALTRINPQFEDEEIDEAVRQVTRLESPSLLVNNMAIHRLLTEGVDISIRQEDGSYRTKKVWLIDKANVDNNDWLVVNQFRVHESGVRPKILDVVVFLNGLPLVVFELKNWASERVRITDAYDDIKGYQANLPTFFAYNAFSVISDGAETRYGTLTANYDRYMVWRTMDGKVEADSSFGSLEVLIKGMFEKELFLDYLTHFILFQVDGSEMIKIAAAYHQVYATRKAVESTHRASAEQGDRKIGVIWHTQGSGKSLSMVFYAGKLIAEMNNPTIVVVTDRNDLDDQLFSTFSKSQQLLRQTPTQAEDMKKLRELLSVEAGGIIFTTIQKFMPEEGEERYPVLTNRRNVVVIVDEAHRSQYGFEAIVQEKKGNARVKFGFAKHMRDALPEASYIGFTGTPIELADRNTPAVFGDYIDIYDMTRAVEDGATVKIYYESRLAMLELPEQEKEKLDQEVDKLLQDQEVDSSVKGKWARLETLVGSEDRLHEVAKDIVTHFETRLKQIEGKGMIVTISRRIAARLYEEIVQLRPDWHHDSLERGAIKVVMTSGKDDDELMQKHHTSKAERERLAKRMKDPEDELKLVIVCDMWLTGFDVPCLHTLYVDKPMKGHNLMQAIARVNRVFRDKPGGLVVDYIGIAHALKEALKVYSPSDREMAGVDTEQAVALMKEKLEIIQQMLSGHDYNQYFTGTAKEKAQQIASTVDFVLGFSEEDRKEFIKQVTILEKAYTLCVTHPEAKKVDLEIGFFKAVKVAIKKLETPPPRPRTHRETLDAQINQLISKSVITQEVVDIYEAVGLEKPNISILSEKFIDDVKNLEHKNLAVELLNRLLKEQIREVSRRNQVQSKKLSELLDEAIYKYYNRIIESTIVVEQLINLAKKVEKVKQREQELGLSVSELAFYDALNEFEFVKQNMTKKDVIQFVHILDQVIRKERSVDWNVRVNGRSNMRRKIKWELRKNQFPREILNDVAELLLEQCELLEKNSGYEEEESSYSYSREVEKIEEISSYKTYEQWDSLDLDLVQPQYRSVVEKLRNDGLPKPEVGYVIINSSDEVVGEAEFAWPKEQICFLTPEQGDFRDKIRGQGWKVFVLPEKVENSMDFKDIWDQLIQKN